MNFCLSCRVEYFESHILSWVSLLELGYSLKNISHTWNQAKRMISFLIGVKQFSRDILFILWLLYSIACISCFRESSGMLLVLCHLPNLISHVSPQPGLGLFSCWPSWDCSDGWASALDATPHSSTGGRISRSHGITVKHQ